MLDEVKGLDIGTTYRNRTYAKTFIQSIADVEFSKVASIINDAKFVCTIGDGSTDSSVKEQEMWYARTCDQGKIQLYFIGVEAVEKATAENIVKGLKFLLQSNLNIDGKGEI